MVRLHSGLTDVGFCMKAPESTLEHMHRCMKDKRVHALLVLDAGQGAVQPSPRPVARRGVGRTAHVDRRPLVPALAARSAAVVNPSQICGQHWAHRRVRNECPVVTTRRRSPRCRTPHSKSHSLSSNVRRSLRAHERGHDRCLTSGL
jgi:hypothetical protein